MSQADRTRFYKQQNREMVKQSRKAQRARVTRVARAVWVPTKWTAQHGWRWRRGLAPVYAVGAGYGTGALAWLLASVDGPATLGAFMILLVLIGAKGMGLPGRPKAHLSPRVAGAAWGGLGAWIALTMVTAIVGPAVPVPGFWLLWMLGAGVPWWISHWRASRPIEAPATVAEVTDGRITTWDTWVAKQNGAAPGSKLIDLVEIEPGTFADVVGPQVGDQKGWTATVKLPGADFPATRLMGQEARARIAGAYSVAVNDVVVERTGREDRAKVTIMSSTATDAIIEYDETWQVEKDGCVPLTVHPDGRIGWIQVWLPGSGGVHELYAGDSGGGKSRGMELAITQSAMTGHVVPIVADPQEGASFPAWGGVEGAALWAAGDIDEIDAQLASLEVGMDTRGRFMSQVPWKDEDGITRRGLGHWDTKYMMAEHGMPLLEYTLDEAPDILAEPELADRMERIARKARKCGIKLRLGTQYPSQDQLGNRVTIRQQLAGGNIVCFRTAIRGGKDLLMPSYMPDPYEIPKEINGQHTKGVCVLNSAAPNGGIASYSRAGFIRNGFKWRDAVAHLIPDLDPLMAGAMGIDVAAWRRRLAGDITAEPVVSREVITVANITDQTADDTGGKPVTRVPTKKEQILAYLRDVEVARTGQIAHVLDVALPTVTQTLKRLAQKEVVADDGHGRWSIVKQPKPANTNRS